MKRLKQSQITNWSLLATDSITLHGRNCIRSSSFYDILLASTSPLSSPSRVKVKTACHLLEPSPQDKNEKPPPEDIRDVRSSSLVERIMICHLISLRPSENQSSFLVTNHIVSPPDFTVSECAVDHTLDKNRIMCAYKQEATRRRPRN